MTNNESHRSDTVAYNARGTSVLATPEQAARAREGKQMARARRLEAAERIAREVLAKMAGEAPAEIVMRYAALKGKGEWRLALAWVIEAQLRQAVSGKAGSTPAARFVVEMAGLIGRDEEPPAPAPTSGFAIALSSEATLQLVEMMRQRRAIDPEFDARVKRLEARLIRGDEEQE